MVRSFHCHRLVFLQIFINNSVATSGIYSITTAYRLNQLKQNFTIYSIRSGFLLVEFIDLCALFKNFVSYILAFYFIDGRKKSFFFS